MQLCNLLANTEYEAFDWTTLMPVVIWNRSASAGSISSWACSLARRWFPSRCACSGRSSADQRWQRVLSVALSSDSSVGWSCQPINRVDLPTSSIAPVSVIQSRYYSPIVYIAKKENGLYNNWRYRYKQNGTCSTKPNTSVWTFLRS